MKKSDYLKVLRDHKLVENNASKATEDESEPVSTQPSGDPVPAPAPEASIPVEETPEKVIESTASHAAPKSPAAPAAVSSAPAEPELFPGEAALPADVRKQIREQFDAAKRAKDLEQEAKKARDDFNALHGKLAPTQQNLSKLQVEVARLQQELNKHKTSQTDATSASLRKRIEEMKAQFPEDAQMWEGVLGAVDSANQRAAALEKAQQELRQREFINEQLSELTSVHPDWRKKRAAVFGDAQNGYVVQPVVDTPEAKELAVWANALDPYERQTLWPLFTSSRAADAVYLLNRFEHDRALALQQANGQAAPEQQQATQAPDGGPARAALAPDPDPSRRTTAPSTTPSSAGGPRAGQPVSDKHAAYLQATKAWEAMREERAKRARTVRRV